MHFPRALAGELALVAALLGVLGMFWSDGTPNRDPVVDPQARAAAFVPARMVHFGSIGSAVGVKPFDFPPPPAQVPSAPPETILIPSLNVHRPVESVTVDRWGYMYTPANLWNAGWYKGGPVPGAPGDAVIEGHAGYPDKPLLFGHLQQLVKNAQIIVVLADGSRQLFLVQSISIWSANTSPAGMGQPYGVPQLTLITCTGKFDSQYKTYADRLVVQASYAGPM